jgi:heme exporter protein D
MGLLARSGERTARDPEGVSGEPSEVDRAALGSLTPFVWIAVAAHLLRINPDAATRCSARSRFLSAVARDQPDDRLRRSSRTTLARYLRAQRARVHLGAAASALYRVVALA